MKAKVSVRCKKQKQEKHIHVLQTLLHTRLNAGLVMKCWCRVRAPAVTEDFSSLYSELHLPWASCNKTKGLLE